MGRTGKMPVLREEATEEAREEMTAEANKVARCTLCPGLCPLGLAWSGPDNPRVEFPTQAGSGLCPRGSALGELLTAPGRLRWPRRRDGARQAELSWPAAIESAARLMAGGATVLIDGNLPLEEISACAELAAQWKGLALCCVIAPEDEQTLLGVEASGAAYLADDELARCDGFLAIGDPFWANPRCARGVLDGLKAHPRSPLVVIDSGGGMTGNFATLKPACQAGGELAALSDKAVLGMLTNCKRLGVLIAPEAARGGIWQRVGFLAGQFATAHGGGVSVQTIGANALAALRAGRRLKLLTLAEALSPRPGARVALGVDVLGLLGWSGPPVALAAAALADETTASADLVLPLALICEIGGTIIEAGNRPVVTAPLMPPPSGVPTTSELLRRIALAAGVNVAPFSGALAPTERLAVGEPPEPAPVSADGLMLVAARQAVNNVAGSLTSSASWQSKLRPLPELRVSPADAERIGTENGHVVSVQTHGAGVEAVVKVSARLATGVVAISDGYASVRKLFPYAIDAQRGEVASQPVAVKVARKSGKPAEVVGVTK
jgi:hypothetical protein